MSQYSYICGYVPSICDVELHKSLGNNIDFESYKYIRRWWYHMRSFSESEIKLFNRNEMPKSIYKQNSKTIDEQVGFCTVCTCILVIVIN